MLRLAVLSARGRLGTFTGALVALIASSALVMAGAMPFESALRTHPPVERYAGAAAVVTGQQIVGAGPRRPAGRARPRGLRPRRPPGRRPRRPGRDRRRLRAGPPRQPDRRRPRLEQRRADAVRADRRAPARGRRTRSSPATAPRLGARLRLSGGEAARTVTVVGVARPRHPVRQQTAIFLTDAEAARLAGHPGRADAIGVLAGPGFDASRLRAAAGKDAEVLTGDSRGRAEYPDLQEARTTLIAVTASFGGLALFIAIFVVASTMGLSIQQREREIALLRAVAGTPGQIRRMIGWEAFIVGLVGSAAGIWPGIVLGRWLTEGLIDHEIAPPNLTVTAGWLPITAAIAGGVLAALLAVLAAGRRAARVAPTLALANAAVEPRLIGPGRLIGGLIALAGAAPLFAVSTTTGSPETAAATSEMTALFLVAAAGFLGPIVARLAAVVLGPPLAAAVARRRLPGVGQPAHRHAALLVGQHAARAHGRHELHAAVQLHHHRPRRHAGAPRGPGGRPGRHRRRRGGAGRARRRARHARRALGGRRHPHHARPEPRGLRRRAPRRDPQRRPGRRVRRRRDRRVARRPARRHDRAREPARRERARRDRRRGAGRARRRDARPRHRGGDLLPLAGVRRRAARPRARGRPPDRPHAGDDPRPDRASRPPSRGACGRWRTGTPACRWATAPR